MTGDVPQRVVIADASVLINLIHASELRLLRELTAFEFVVTDHVVAEICVPEQARGLEEELERGGIRTVPLEGMALLDELAGLIERMGRGEAACLALAHANGWIVPARPPLGRARRTARASRPAGRKRGDPERSRSLCRAGRGSPDERLGGTS